MTQLLPLRSEVEVADRVPRVVAIDDEAADTVLSVLSTQTARTLLVELYREPTTLSALAEQADTSLQNATYHLHRLEDSGLVEVVDTWYSERGTEMDVYAPTSRPLVVVAGEIDSDANVLRRPTDSGSS